MDTLEHKAHDLTRLRALQTRLKLAATGGGADTATLEARIAANADDLDARRQLAHALALRQDYRAALEQLLGIVRRDRKWRDEAARTPPGQKPVPRIHHHDRLYWARHFSAR